MDHPPAFRQGRALLRQIASAFATYRLYPGEVATPAFVTATEHLASAAEAALAEGPFEVEVRGHGFVLAGSAVPDAGLLNLAKACFERRIEHLRLDRVPEAPDLAAWFEVLVMPAGHVETAGGAALLLQRAGAVSIVVEAGVPETTTGEDTPDELLLLADTADEEDRSEPEPDLTVGPDEDGAALFRRLRSATAADPDRLRGGSRFLQRARELVDGLPLAERARFGRAVIDALATDPFAERYAGHLTDPELAELVVAVADDEHTDRLALAHQVSESAARHGTLVPLVATARSTAARASRRAVPSSPRAATSSGGDRVLRDGFPPTEEEGRRLALLALHDYLRVEDRTDRLDAVLAAATAQLRGHVAAGELDPLAGLLAVLAGAHADGREWGGDRMERPRRETLTAALLRDLADRDRLRTGLVAPFGEAAVDPLVGALGLQGSSGGTRALSEVLVTMGRQHPQALERRLSAVQDVSAGMVAVLGRLDGAVGLPTLARLGRHTDPVVLAAVLEALGKRPADEAAPLVGRIAERSADRRTRFAALDVLAAYPAGGGQGELERLAGGPVGSPLPWRLRRRARALARGSAGRG